VVAEMLTKGSDHVIHSAFLGISREGKITIFTSDSNLILTLTNVLLQV
jgi:hypothetical protein